ncbi:MAG: HU family DNA-binding protein [Deltaproteobacteria bacterium]|jgi:DNA-binding protein HU-beta|nr:HU family DNA-binding protein [Deltaproteobacteria bacterium]MDR1297713.1 HU family DNA-binding protein [Deltaproteobacteria bacterium]
MTKAELISQVAKESEITKVQAQKALESVISNVVKTLKKDGRFPIFGLGVFQVVKRPKRKGRNPRSGETLVIKAHKAVKFKPAKVLKEAVNSLK